MYCFVMTIQIKEIRIMLKTLDLYSLISKPYSFLHDIVLNIGPDDVMLETGRTGTAGRETDDMTEEERRKNCH